MPDGLMNCRNKILESGSWKYQGRIYPEWGKIPSILHQQVTVPGVISEFLDFSPVNVAINRKNSSEDRSVVKASAQLHNIRI